jgi:retron-type reverse transcriptase
LEFGYYQHSLVGTPQGSIISPILSNIYLHELDKFIIKLSSEFNIGSAPSRNPEYRRIENLKAKTNLVSEKVALHKKLISIPSKAVFDEKFKRLVYIRYADD